MSGLRTHAKASLRVHGIGMVASDDRRLTDEEYSSGFASLHEAIANGFDTLPGRLEGELARIRGDVGGLEARMLRRFDAVDERFDAIETRLNGMDVRLDKIDIRLDRIELRLDAMGGQSPSA